MPTTESSIMTATVTKADIAEIKRSVNNNDFFPNFALVAEVRHTGGERTGNLIVHQIIDQPEDCTPSTVTRTHAIATEVRMEIYRTYIAKRIVASQSVYRTSISAAHSLARILRDGDTIQTFWLIGNDSENLRDAGLTHDTCTIRVYRNGKFVVEIPLADTITRTDGYVVGFEDRSVFR